MTPQQSRALTCALVLLALALLLPTATHAATPRKTQAQKRSASQKKTGAKKNPFEAAKPDASKTQQTTTQANGQTPTAQQLPPSILVRWQGRPGVNRYRLQLST